MLWRRYKLAAAFFFNGRAAGMRRCVTRDVIWLDAVCLGSVDNALLCWPAQGPPFVEICG